MNFWLATTVWPSVVIGPSVVIESALAHCPLQSAYHGGQKCVSAEVKLQILKERMAGRNDTKLIQELKRKEQDLLSLASIEVGPFHRSMVALTMKQCLEHLKSQAQILGLQQ